jgi:hypothetical protein
MTDDLVKQLRKSSSSDYMCQGCTDFEREEAADRIEKLELALRKIMNLGQSAVPDHWEARCLARDTARKALEGES